jgi:WD40 repeat protein
METGQQKLTTKAHSGRVVTLAFSADGQRLASGSDDRTVKVWDTAHGHELLMLNRHTEPVTRVTFSADGTRIATGSFGLVQVCDAVTGKELLTLRGHAHAAIVVAFSGDGQRVVSGSNEFGKPGEVKVWDAATGQELLNLQGHTEGVVSVAFSADGQHIISGSTNGTVRIWEAPFDFDAENNAPVSVKANDQMRQITQISSFCVASCRSLSRSRARLFSGDGLTLYSSGHDGALTCVLTIFPWRRARFWRPLRCSSYANDSDDRLPTDGSFGAE